MREVFPGLLIGVLCVLPSAAGAASRPLDGVRDRSVRLTISPETIRLSGRNRQQQILVTAMDREGKSVDVTHHCRFTLADSRVALIRRSTLFGATNGTTRLVVRFGKLRRQAVVSVTEFDTFPPVHFVNDIIPIFSKLGCNSGGCHGKRSGQNGFRLSVFGSDPKADFASLVKETRGRRAFPADPENSLLILKATGRMAHGGGRRTEPDSSAHSFLREWVRQGMPWGSKSAAKLSRIVVEPASRVLDVSADQQIRVTALYSDGRRRDVTAASTFTTNAAAIAEVDRQGRIRSGKNPGEAAMTVNYMGQVAVVRILVPRSLVTGRYPVTPENNRIDRFVWTKLKRMGIVSSGLCDDATFLRRLYLDAIGTLPTPQEVKSFLADRRPDKRKLQIDAVLNRAEFADYWALKFSDILLVNSETLGERGAYQFHHWLRKQFAENRPYDQWVRELLTATGDTARNGPVNFYRALRKPDDLTRAVSQAFLGIRLDCCQCHHHPFERWSREDFYGLAGFFKGIQRVKRRQNREVIFHAGYQPARMPLTGELVPTKPPGGPVPKNLNDGDPRVKLADWITSAKNPWFARLVVNRLWKHYLGRGLIEPEDDLRSTNPATNEPLLSFLTEQVVKNRFDLKAVMRLILQSRVYQLSSEANASNSNDEQNFSHFFIKRLPAEVLLDAVGTATGTTERFPGLPRGTRTIQLWDNRRPSYFLDTFGRSERKSPCECGKSNAATMTQALHLMNAPEIDAKITDRNGRIARLIAAKASQKQIVNELCLAALGRPAKEKERKAAAKLFAAQNPKTAAEDFLWALLNSYDFLFVR